MNKDFDIDKLLGAVDNESNESIMKLNNRKIKQIKNDLLQKLHFKKEDMKMLHAKLKEYRFVDDLKDINYGRYIRWINMNNIDNLKLTNGGIVCEILATENGTTLTCKNNTNRLFRLKMDECLVFQKLTNQEKTILSVLDYVDKQ
jgi:hypothetical protein